MVKGTEAYPLSWPAGERRSPKRTKSIFQPRTFGQARDALLGELGRLGAKKVILSTNIPLRQDGLPRADFARYTITDPGVAVYFEWKGQKKSMACDRWTRIEDNVHALFLSIAALRGIERWGATRILERAFMGFTLLPAPPQWFDILELEPTASVDEIRAAYRKLARPRHPDSGGSDYAMAELNRALQEALAEKERR